jgi:hypothetical protein
LATQSRESERIKGGQVEDGRPSDEVIDRPPGGTHFLDELPRITHAQDFEPPKKEDGQRTPAGLRRVSVSRLLDVDSSRVGKASSLLERSIRRQAGTRVESPEGCKAPDKREQPDVQKTGSKALAQEPGAKHDLTPADKIRFKMERRRQHVDNEHKTLAALNTQDAQETAPSNTAISSFEDCAKTDQPDKLLSGLQEGETDTDDHSGEVPLGVKASGKAKPSDDIKEGGETDQSDKGGAIEQRSSPLTQECSDMAFDLEMRDLKTRRRALTAGLGLAEIGSFHRGGCTPDTKARRKERDMDLTPSQHEEDSSDTGDDDRGGMVTAGIASRTPSHRSLEQGSPALVRPLDRKVKGKAREKPSLPGPRALDNLFDAPDEKVGACCGGRGACGARRANECTTM